MAADIKVFDRLARIYDLVAPPAAPERVTAVLDRADRPITVLLDVGGGPGRAVRSLFVTSKIVVDPAPGMARRARRHELTAVVGIGEALPIATNSVDAAIISDALHHMVDQQAVIAELGRVIAPGGVLGILDFDPTTVRGRLLAFGEHTIGFESTFFPPDRLAEMVSNAGFRASVIERGFAYTVCGVALEIPNESSKA